MKTAAYSICKNEANNIAQWMKYTDMCDYRVLLDTGSTDNTINLALSYPRVIIDRYVPSEHGEDFRFNDLRNRNLAMVPSDVDWCIQPDLDEYFTENWLDELKIITNQNSALNTMTYDVILYMFGPKPLSAMKDLGDFSGNKIHKREGFHWVEPIYEYVTTETPIEEFSKLVQLHHKQEVDKPRKPLYLEIALREIALAPTNGHIIWFLVDYYFKNKEMIEYQKWATEYIKYSKSPCNRRSTIFMNFAMMSAEQSGFSEEVFDFLYQSIKNAPHNKKAWALMNDLSSKML